ncbi:MAG: serine/threonine-protein kinase [Gemmataceae bacterium]
MNETEDYRSPADDQPPDLVEAVREYQTALDSGRRPNRQEFLTRYPHLADELAECLDGLEFLHSTAGRMRPAPPAVATVEAPPIDGTLGDFRLLREIGRGGMGVVYEAEQISLRRRVALKVLPLAATLDVRQLMRFENEARAAALLHHPHIVPVFAVGCERGVHYYAMQLITGRTLAEVIDHLRRAPTGAAPAAETAADAVAWTRQSVTSRPFFRAIATLGLQAADALEYAHQMGVVHRDIKPANLLLDDRGSLWVTDFGLARFQASPVLTSPGDLVGTLRYMSPEQASGQPVIDPRSDVYSLGITLYELLTQQPAFPATSRQECLRQILEEDPKNPRSLNPAIPAELELVVLKAMAKAPEERYATARHLADDLRRFLDDQPVQARRPGLQTRAVKWVARHRRFVVAAVVGLMAAVVGLAVTTFLVAQAESHARDAYDQLKKEEGRTATALAEEKVQRTRAETSYRQARKVLDYLTRLGVDEMANRPDLQPLRRRLLTELIAYYTELIDGQDGDPDVTAELVETRLQVAELLDEVGRKAESFLAFERAMRERQRLPGGPPQGFGPFGPPRSFSRFFLLQHPAVQTELGLSPEQNRAVTAAFDFGGKPPTGEQLARADEALNKVLSAAQNARLDQLIRQTRGASGLLDPDAATALGLSERQKEQLHAAQRRGMPGRGPRDRRGHGGPGGPPDKGPGGPPPDKGPPPDDGHGRGPRSFEDRPGRGPRPADGDRKAASEAMLRVLTPEQRTKWQELLGAPFKADLPPGPPPPRDPPPEE